MAGSSKGKRECGDDGNGPDAAMSASDSDSNSTASLGGAAGSSVVTGRSRPCSRGVSAGWFPITPREILDACEAIFQAAATMQHASGTQTPLWTVPLRVLECEIDETETTPRTNSTTRVARVLTYEPARNRTVIATVRLSDKRITNVRVPVNVQPAMDAQEYEAVEKLIGEYEPFVKAIARRGVPTLEVAARVMVDPWCVGYFDEQDDARRRLCRPLVYLRRRADERDNGYATPVEGVSICVDLAAMRIIEFHDEDGHNAVPLPPEDDKRNFRALVPPPHVLKPLHISQPSGPSFEVNGYHVRWLAWDFSLGFTSREGLVIHDICLRNPASLAQKASPHEQDVRTVMRRFSFVEMVVPYADPRAPHYRKNAFDAGEDGLGRNANSLRIGCDCNGHIHYFDAHMPVGPMAGAKDASEVDVRTIENAICLHEEDDGLAWKHTDWRTGIASSVRRRRLTVSFISTIANYSYGFYVHFTNDGHIDVETKLTGILSVGVDRDHDNPTHGTIVAPGVVAPLHQHFFVARAHMAVDGDNMTAHVVQAKTLPPDASTNPHANAFVWTERRMHPNTPSGTASLGNGVSVFDVRSTTRRNRLGRPTAYRLIPSRPITPLAHESAAYLRRAAFLGRQVWLTKYDPEQRYPGGEFPNQSSRDSRAGLRWIRERGPGSSKPPMALSPAASLDASTAGLVEWCSQSMADAAADDAPASSVVLWHVYGVTHIPRPEEWPVMPVEQVGFSFVPCGFFDTNPLVDSDDDGSSARAGQHTSRL